jgi:hypothetical protein
VITMKPARDNSWLVYHSLLAVLPAEKSGSSTGMDEGMRILRIPYLWYVNRSFTCRKILRHGTSGFTSNPKEGMVRIFIALKSASRQPGLTPRPLGPVSSTLTTIPPWLLNINTKQPL